MLAQDIYNNVKNDDSEKLRELESLNPMDRLDPCCQKEIDSERRKATVMTALKRDDRTDIKYKLRQATINSLKGNNCICCHETSDYSALSQLRNYYCSDINPNNSFKQEDIDDNSDSNSDSDLDLLDDILTPYEQERLERSKEAIEKLQIATSIGLGKHIEASLEHLTLQIQQYHNVVLHIYDPESMFCANIDLYLEQISKQYVGTIFRRVNSNNNQINSFKQKWKINSNNNTNIAICCFRAGALISSSSDINLLWDGETLQKYELTNFFENTHCLTDDISTSIEAFDKFSKLNINNTDNDDDNDDNDDFTCDEPGCGRKFRHEHVKANKSIIPSSTKSVGIEALNENIFYRI